jgi:5-methylcytosine-specific restriction enzyme subunit McrC
MASHQGSRACHVITREARCLEIEEWVPARLPSTALTLEQGKTLLLRYKKFIDVQFPSPRTDDEWEVKSTGWVGVLRVDEEVVIAIKPKVRIVNLTRMLAIAYDLPVEVYRELVRVQTMPELYDHIAAAMAREALSLIRTGPLQRYQEVQRDVSAIRGRVDVLRMVTRLPSPTLPCQFGERSADVIENQIPLWTAERLLRSGLCAEPTERLLREAYRRCVTIASLRPVIATDCDVNYDRLSERYRTLLALCRLLLETMGPITAHGGATSVPFVLSMHSLYERFVAKWMMRELGSSLRVETQQRFTIGDGAEIPYVMDLVVYDVESDRPICVLDTKYKNAGVPSSDDVAQTGFYALMLGCPLAGLVYPVRHPGEWTGKSGDVNVFRTTFDIGSDLDAAGMEFKRAILKRIDSVRGQAAGLLA